MDTTTKKKFKHTLLGKISIGIVDGLTGGSISKIVYDDELKPAGKIDQVNAVPGLITIIILIAYLTNKINYETFTTLINMFK